MKYILVPAIAGLLSLSGCHQYGGGVRVESPPPQRVENLPPAHAPAYGRRRQQQHHYYYYPEAEFYFDVGRNVYFYLDSRGNWSVSVNLPRHLRHHINGYYVELDMFTDRPYLEHHEHKRKYKKQKYKKHKNRKGNKHHKRDDDDDYPVYRNHDRY
ncbi:MAG: hypothetical protein PVH16_03420 [Thioalkalispiraceae bacterium]|jgi:hypothetical protein